MSIAIIIVNFRTPKLTIDCLRSLALVREECPGSHAVVVENASNDGCAETIRDEITSKGWTPWMTVLASDVNRGFAGGNNLGIDWALKNIADLRYVLLLNSDTIAAPGVLASCLATMESDLGIGMMSCKLLNADGSIQNVTRRFPSPIQQTLCSMGLPWKWPKWFGWANVYEVPEPMLTTKRDCEWIGGAFMFIRREALLKVGLLDEGFFFYGEDIEYCHRFHKAGFRIHYDPATAITHLGGSSSDPTRMAATARSRRMWQSRYLVQRKCYGRLAAWWIRLVDISVFGARKAKMFFLGQKNTTAYRQVSEAFSILTSKLSADL